MPQLSAFDARERETSILTRLQRRDPAALGELYDLYGRVAYSTILRIVRNPAAAEDLVQETFLRVWTRAHQLDPARTSAEPWLLTIARNRALDYFRKPAPWNLASARRLEETEDPKRFADWERGILSGEAIEALRIEFSKLRPSEKMAIELAYFGGLSLSEMAEYFRHPQSTIKTLIRSALIRLRVAFEGVEAKPASSDFRPPVVMRPHKTGPGHRPNAVLYSAHDVDRDEL